MNRLFPIAILLFLFAACTGNKKEAAPALPDGHYCYIYNLSFDTILLDINVAQGKVEGTMQYIFHEKATSTGKITGTLTDNRLLAEYSPADGGMDYASELIFAYSDGEFNVGFGEMDNVDGKLVYQDTSKINFDTFALRPADCK